MKCPKCKGTGRVPRPDGTELFGLTELMTCDLCRGNGEVTLTNEEYIRTCSTGDLAALIYQDRWTQSDGWYEQTGHTVEDVKKWLKEIRK